MVTGKNKNIGAPVHEERQQKWNTVPKGSVREPLASLNIYIGVLGNTTAWNRVSFLPPLSKHGRLAQTAVKNLRSEQNTTKLAGEWSKFSI